MKSFCRSLFRLDLSLQLYLPRRLTPNLVEWFVVLSHFLKRLPISLASTYVNPCAKTGECRGVLCAINSSHGLFFWLFIACCFSKEDFSYRYIRPFTCNQSCAAKTRNNPILDSGCQIESVLNTNTTHQHQEVCPFFLKTSKLGQYAHGINSG